MSSEPVSYLTVPIGTDVISADGERVGVVELVLADEDTGIFDGIVIDATRGPGGLRFVDAPEVRSIDARGVAIRVAAADVRGLRRPSPNPAVMQHTGVEDHESALQAKLRTAWAHLARRFL